MRKLNGTGLNPKCDITAKEVSEVDIEEVFWQGCEVQNHKHSAAC